MLTKYQLIIGSETYELRTDDLKNWDDVKCAFKRSDYGGIVRSFTSKFEFTNRAREIVLAEFLSKGFMAQATLVLCVINNVWEFTPLYSCELDFTTLSFDDHTLSINAVEASIESKIKATKSTKFELIPGQEVKMESCNYLFDRMEMIESVDYHISDGNSQDDGSIIGSLPGDSNGRIMIGVTNSEIAVGGAIYYKDDQEYGDGFLIQALKPVQVKFTYAIEASMEYLIPPLTLMVNNSVRATIQSQLRAKPRFIPGNQNNEADTMAFIEENADLRYRWENENLEHPEYWIEIGGLVYEIHYDNDDDGPTGKNFLVNTNQTVLEYTKVVSAGTIELDLSAQDKVWISSGMGRYCYLSSKLTFSWVSRGEKVNIGCLRPLSLLEALLSKMGIECGCEISSFDARLKDVLLLPAEFIRALPDAKVYASFNDFTGWMETVFGYVYTINEESNTIAFRHRSEIFSDQAPVIELTGIKDSSFSLAKDVLYSSLSIGYNKQDYNSINGRNEFNFGSSYTTKFPIEGKKLELKSAFRADSYGIEFLVEKRGQDSTDNTSDSGMFFVMGQLYGSQYRPVRNVTITEALTDSFVNGEFAPTACVQANVDYISMMASSMELVFASTEGNGDAVIDGTSVSGNIFLENCQMLTAGELKFTCSDQNIPADLNCLIRVRTDEYEYEGFIQEASFQMARPEAVNYTLMIKSQKPCL